METSIIVLVTVVRTLLVSKKALVIVENPRYNLCAQLSGDVHPIFLVRLIQRNL